MILRRALESRMPVTVGPVDVSQADGVLTLGFGGGPTLAGTPVIALRGRVHLNEAPADPDLPMMVRLQTEMLLQLGVKTLILTNAAGGINTSFEQGALMVIDDHIAGRTVHEGAGKAKDADAPVIMEARGLQKSFSI